MRMTKEALSTVILVRRVRIGAAPFRWEVHRAGNADPIHVSSDHYKSMEAAFRAGQARLEEFIPKRSMPPGVTKLRLSQAGHVGVDTVMQE
jgi:hypothetical protein